jgi:hypothetical protein
MRSIDFQARVGYTGSAQKEGEIERKEARRE